MITTNSKNGLIKSLIETEDSTTLLLESLKGMKLNVSIESQVEKMEYKHCVIERVTRLFFDSPETPVLYCTSYLYKEALTKDEYYFLVEKEMPLGKLFMQLNDAEMIKKKNILTTSELNQYTADQLNVKGPWVFRKEYEYWICNRKMGQIIEYFNEESLRRV